MRKNISKSNPYKGNNKTIRKEIINILNLQHAYIAYRTKRNTSFLSIQINSETPIQKLPKYQSLNKGIKLD